MNRSEKVFLELQRKFPGTVIIKKSSSRLMKIIDLFLKIITFGSMKTFMSSFITTIGRTIYVPDSWDARSPESQAMTLRHEGIHIAQEQRLGSLRYKLTYLLWIFPCFFAVGRRNLEQEAYAESLRAQAEYFGLRIIRDPRIKKHILNHFTSSEYFWMWPWKKQLNEWFDSTISMIEKEHKSEK